MFTKYYYMIKFKTYTMKFLRTLAAAALFLTLSSSSYVMAQCSGGTQSGTLDPVTTAFQFFTTGVAGEYQTFTAVFGEQYEFSYCTTDGGSTSYDSEITILDNSDVFVGFSAGGYSDDDCGGGTESHTIFTPTSSGTYRVLTNLLTCGTNITTSVLAYRSVVIPVDIEEKSPIETLKVSPNPTSGVVRIILDDFHGERLDVLITDITGRVAVDKQNVNADGAYTASYNLSALTKGMYLLTLKAGDYSRTEKIILN